MTLYDYKLIQFIYYIHQALIPVFAFYKLALFFLIFFLFLLNDKKNTYWHPAKWMKINTKVREENLDRWYLKSLI